MLVNWFNYTRVPYTTTTNSPPVPVIRPSSVEDSLDPNYIVANWCDSVYLSLNAQRDFLSKSVRFSESNKIHCCKDFQLM